MRDDKYSAYPSFLIFHLSALSSHLSFLIFHLSSSVVPAGNEPTVLHLGEAIDPPVIELHVPFHLLPGTRRPPLRRAEPRTAVFGHISGKILRAQVNKLSRGRPDISRERRVKIR